YNVHMGFYAQHQLEALHLNHEILEELKQEGTGKSELQLRQILGSFLFTGDDVFKKIKVLSGGEKSRVALAKTLIGESNFLLLDEPTNHLDFQSENILIQALQQYEGTFIIVSHNRHFVSQVANKIWYIEGQDIKEYPGTYEEYKYWKSKQNPVEAELKPQAKKKRNSDNPQPAKAKQQKDRETMLKSQVSKIEKQIESLELQIKELEEEMAKPAVFSDPDRLAEVNTAFQKLKEELESLHEQWEEKVLALDDVED
ncbi:MAG: ATP-binding cassette domain-containing protein, partial [Fulvivirga sp.]|nr:ATP-binding cassette domain-containing protein [Fulvivirga sp.]